jgi:hypothetical protein
MAYCGACSLGGELAVDRLREGLKIAPNVHRPTRISATGQYLIGKPTRMNALQ